MIITHETTIEEYKAWLDTNPDFSALQVAVRSTLRTISRAVSKIESLIKKVKNRSCLTGKKIHPVSRRDNKAFLDPEFCKWSVNISLELQRTTDYIQRLEQEERRRDEQLALIDDEISMEQLKIQALEILSKSTKSN